MGEDAGRGVAWVPAFGLTCAAESSVHAVVSAGCRDGLLGAGWAGKAGALVAAVAVRETVTLAGQAERARAARAFVVAVLGPGRSCAADAELLVSELFGNNVRHGGSGGAGETVTVAVRVTADLVRVEVTGRSGLGVPRVGRAGQHAEGGRGLQIVARLSARWGWRRRGRCLVTWFELCDLSQLIPPLSTGS